MLVDRTGIEPAVPVGNTISGPLMVDQLGVEPRSLPRRPINFASQRRLVFFGWCLGPDSNRHALSGTRLSTSRVYLISPPRHNMVSVAGFEPAVSSFPTKRINQTFPHTEKLTKYWRKLWDSNPRTILRVAGFQGRSIRPLCQTSFDLVDPDGFEPPTYSL